VLTQSVRRFLEDHFDSVTALEVLLLLHREQPRSWTCTGVARRLRIDTDQTRNILDDLADQRLVRRAGFTFEYDPGNEDAASAVEQVAGLYSGYRVRIRDLIVHSPVTGRPCNRGLAP
jgi:hypothetical protein